MTPTPPPPHVCEPPPKDWSGGPYWTCPIDNIRHGLVKRMIGRKLYAEWRRMPGQPTELDQIRSSVAAVVALCRERQAEAEDGSWTDAETLWPSEVLAALDLPVSPPEEQP